jgi:PPE-repeat protein
VNAHAPYLASLTNASADSAAMASQQEIVAGAFTTALAGVPTLAELAANHAAHAALVATNFFGINTIPVALNEADYVRMWIQAAGVMSTYQAVATAAVVAAPRFAAAPQIVTAPASAEALALPPDRTNAVYEFLERIGYIDFYNNYLEPLINALYDVPFFQAIFSGFDPYLPILGNPLTFLSPFNIAFALGYPMDIGSYVAYLSQTFAFIALDLTAAFASGDPATIGLTILFTTVEAIGTIITDTIALLKTLLEQTAVLLTVALPLLTAPLAPLAAGAVLVPLGAKGLAALVAVPPPALAVTPVAPPVAALAPSVPTSTAPSPAPAEVTATAPAPGPTPPATAPPPVSGAGVGVGMENFGYMVGGLTSAAKRAADSTARKKAPEHDGAEVPAVAATPQEPTRSPRRRRARVKQIDRGWGYMDLEDEQTGAGALGFAGTVPTQTTTGAAGLTTLADDAFGGGPRTPMVPGTWDGKLGAAAGDS